MKQFFTRSLTSIVYAIVMVAGMVIHPWFFAGVFLVILFQALREYGRLVKMAGAHPQQTACIVISLLFFILIFGHVSGYVALEVSFVVIPLFFILFITEIFRKKPRPFANIGYTLLGFFYIALPISLTNFLLFPGLPGNHEFYPWILLGMVIIIWSFDSGAYIVGTAIGKHRLLERISPKKSWEGVIGGALFAALASLCIAFFIDSVEYTGWLVISAIVALFGTLGDLFESMFKRSLEIKDSGNLLPGHGGVLDRFDSFLFTVPFVLIWLYISGHL